MDNVIILQFFNSLIGFFLMALGVFLFCASFQKKGCLWLVSGCFAVGAAVAFASLGCSAVVAGGAFGALLFAVVHYFKGGKDD